MNKKNIFYLIISCYVPNLIGYVSPINLFIPYDSLIRPHKKMQPGFQFFAYGEQGLSHARGYNEKGDRTNPLQIYSAKQNALSMLEGFDPLSDIGQLAARIGAVDDGTRGHFLVSGKLHNEFSGGISLEYSQCGRWSAGLYLPIYSYELKDILFEDQTKSITDDDIRVKELLTNSIEEILYNFGDKLSIKDWKRTGAGDLAVLVRWYQEFVQYRPFLKQVDISFETGVITPTGKQEDRDKLFAFAFGSDGAFSIPFRLGLNLHLGYYVQAGVDVQLTHTFSNTRQRRIKTSDAQTNLLLLQKAQAHKDFGLTQRFNLHTEFYEFLGGLSLLFGYQFIKHGEDEMFLKTTKFSSNIVNTAETLEEWTMHHVLIKGTYDFGVHMCNYSWSPQFSVIARLPFNGKLIAAEPAVGVSVAIDF